MKAITRTLIALAAAVTLTSVAAAGSGAAGRAEHHRDAKSLAVSGIRFAPRFPRTGSSTPANPSSARASGGRKARRPSSSGRVSPTAALPVRALSFWARPCADPAPPSRLRSRGLLARGSSWARPRPPSGGKPAKHVVLRVRKDLGCDPGFFFTWDASWGGAFWKETHAGDTIRVWIVDIGRTFLVLEAETSISNSHSSRSRSGRSSSRSASSSPVHALSRLGVATVLRHERPGRLPRPRLLRV